MKMSLSDYLCHRIVLIEGKSDYLSSDLNWDEIVGNELDKAGLNIQVEVDANINILSKSSGDDA